MYVALTKCRQIKVPKLFFPPKNVIRPLWFVRIFLLVSKFQLGCDLFNLLNFFSSVTPSSLIAICFHLFPVTYFFTLYKANIDVRHSKISYFVTASSCTILFKQYPCNRNKKALSNEIRKNALCKQQYMPINHSTCHARCSRNKKRFYELMCAQITCKFLQKTKAFNSTAFSTVLQTNHFLKRMTSCQTHLRQLPHKKTSFTPSYFSK